MRAVGFDDAPFRHSRRAKVTLVGAVCAGTRFEGLVVGSVVRDGWTATREIVRLLRSGKFLPQLHLVLIDGIAFGGLALVDLEALSRELERPCVAVMRRHPDVDGMKRAILKLPRAHSRIATLERAGPVHSAPPFYFQVQGGDPDAIARVLPRLTDRGHVPECLRLAHLIGSAMITGESGKRA